MGATRICGVCEDLDLKSHGSRRKQFTVHLDKREARGKWQKPRQKLFSASLLPLGTKVWRKTRLHALLGAFARGRRQGAAVISENYRQMSPDCFCLPAATLELQAVRRQQHTQGFRSACVSALHPLWRTTVFQACSHRHRMPLPFYSQRFLCNIHRSCVLLTCPFATRSDSVLALLGMRIPRL